jgi:transcriptional regulator with XRE-family HTH domain
VDKASIGRRIAKKRIEAGFKQADFVRLIGVKSPMEQWRYEEGRTLPETERLIEIANKLDISLDYLITGKTKEPPAHENRPLYPKSWELYKKTAPEDLTDEEAKWLMVAPFASEPEPFRYMILLEQLRLFRKSLGS